MVCKQQNMGCQILPGGISFTTQVLYPALLHPRATQVGSWRSQWQQFLSCWFHFTGKGIKMPLLHQEGEVGAAIGHSRATCQRVPKDGSPGTCNPHLHPGKQATVALDSLTGEQVSAPGIHCYTLSSKILFLSWSAYDRKRLLTTFHEFGLDLTTT